MQNEVQLIVKSGGIVTTEYTINFATCPDTAAIVCLANKIEISSCTPVLDNAIWQQLADEGGTIDLYDGSDNYLTSLTINSFNGTNLIYFDTNILCALAEGVACYFKFSLDVNGTIEYFLDLYPNESISLSYQFTDLNNFSQIGTFSRDFRIPATKRNIEALGPLYDYNFVDDVQSFSRKYTAELRVDTIPISRGYIRVMAAYKQQDFLSDFQVAFYSEAPNFVKAIGEKKLQDLTVLPTISEPTVFTNVTTINSTRIWALIDRGQGSKAFSEGGELNTRQTQNEDAPLYPADLTPCLRADYLLQQIFDDAGFELDASSLMTILSDYYVPWINSEALNLNYAPSDFSFRARNNNVVSKSGGWGYQTFPFDFEVYDNISSYDPTTQVFTAQYSGFYTFQITIEVDNIVQGASGSNYVAWRFAYSDGTTVYTSYLGSFTPINSTTYQFTSQPIFMQIGWYGQMEYRGNRLPGSSIDFVSDACFVEMTNVQVLNGPDITYEYNAPDVKQIDFVSDIIKMHNLAVIPDAAIENKLLLEPMSTYLGSGSTLDWTKKLDTSKDIVIKGTDDIKKSKLYFTYSAGQDTYSKLFVDQGRIYGDYKVEPYTVDANQVPSEFLTGNTEVKLIAQSTPSTQVNGSNIICPRFWTQNGNEPPKFTAPGLRFLYWSETAPIYLFDDATTLDAVYQNVPLLNHYNDTSGFNPDFSGQYDLNWAPETPLHDYTANPENNLFTQYWRDYLDSIYSDDARILEASFALNNTDILSLNFGDYVFVKDAYWRIIELSDYKMGQYESTRLKLLKVSPGAPAIPTCDIIPVSSNLDGSLNFVDLAGNPTAATEFCCKSLNYTWSEFNNKCFSQPSDRPGVSKPNNDSTGKGEITSLNSISVGANNVITTNKLDAGSSTFSVFAGNDIKVSGTNDNLIAVGDTLEVKGDQRGIAMFGKSVETVVPGFALGGGWPQDDRTYKNGAQQLGMVLLSGQGNFVASPAALSVWVEGIANKNVILENDTLWFCEISVAVIDATYANHSAYVTGTIWKDGTAATFASAFVTQYEAGNLGVGSTLAVVVNLATPGEHRFGIQFTFGGGPLPGVRAVMQIKYTQIR